MATTIKTVDRNLIKAYAEARNGVPAVVDQVEEGRHPQPLRIYFEDKQTDVTFDLKPVSWEAFFAEMDMREFAFAYEEDGDDPYYYEFVPLNA